jgi:hypothetical protein
VIATTLNVGRDVIEHPSLGPIGLIVGLECSGFNERTRRFIRCKKPFVEPGWLLSYGHGDSRPRTIVYVLATILRTHNGDRVERSQSRVSIKLLFHGDREQRSHKNLYFIAYSRRDCVTIWRNCGGSNPMHHGALHGIRDISIHSSRCRF